SKIDPICHKFMLSLTKVTLMILVIIITLSQLGVDMSSLVAMLGVAGLAVGLAVQDSLSNLAGGFIVLFSKPFSVGDFVEIDGVCGTVHHINIIQTKLLTIDNKAIYIPNGQVSSAKITNYSSEENRRLDVEFSVSYTTNIAQAKEIISKIIAQNPLALTIPEPTVNVSEHASSSIKILARIWVKNENYWDLDYSMLESVKNEFDKNGIVIPFEQLEVSLKK
ncbi:MAG: mechanosensitive ion channel, partial [Oscillospiraceae bacterium]